MECSAKCRRRPCVHGPLSLHQHLPHVAPQMADSATYGGASSLRQARIPLPQRPFARGQDPPAPSSGDRPQTPPGAHLRPWTAVQWVDASGPLGLRGCVQGRCHPAPSHRRECRGPRRGPATHTREPPDLPRRCWASGSADSGLSLSIRGSNVSIHPLWGASVVTGKASSVATLAKSPAWLCLRVPVPDTDGGHVS